MYNDGFSIITATCRDLCINNIIENYLRQSIDKKELIIIINNDNIDIELFTSYTFKNSNIYVYKLPQSISLGECLNFGVSLSNYNFIAKFDDDDYYGPYYLKESYDILSSNYCDIVGKNKTYYYIEELNKLVLKNNGIENNFVPSVMGSTLCFKKNLFDNVKFRDLEFREDYFFNSDCLKKGYKIFSSSRFNHIVYKFSDNSKHTWKCNLNFLLKNCIDIIVDTNLEDCISMINYKI